MTVVDQNVLSTFYLLAQILNKMYWFSTRPDIYGFIHILSLNVTLEWLWQKHSLKYLKNKIQ